MNESTPLQVHNQDSITKIQPGQMLRFERVGLQVRGFLSRCTMSIVPWNFFVKIPSPVPLSPPPPSCSHPPPGSSGLPSFLLST